MLGAISLQEDIMGMEDRFEISSILDTLSLKNSQEERSTRQLGVQEIAGGWEGGQGWEYSYCWH